MYAYLQVYDTEGMFLGKFAVCSPNAVQAQTERLLAMPDVGCVVTEYKEVQTVNASHELTKALSALSRDGWVPPVAQVSHVVCIHGEVYGTCSRCGHSHSGVSYHAR